MTLPNSETTQEHVLSTIHHIILFQPAVNIFAAVVLHFIMPTTFWFDLCQLSTDALNFPTIFHNRVFYNYIGYNYYMISKFIALCSLLTLLLYDTFYCY